MQHRSKINLEYILDSDCKIAAIAHSEFILLILGEIKKLTVIRGILIRFLVM